VRVFVIIDVSLSVSPILDETGAVVGAAWVARDISARLRAEAEQQVLEARLRQSERMETLGQLAGGIAHDFNNLLGIIVGSAGLLADQVAGDADQLTDLRRIEDAAQRAAALTRQLLIFGQRDLTQPQDVQLNDVISAVRELLSASLGGGVDLRFDPGARLPAIRIDRGHVEHVLVNLVFNARDAMPKGGTVAVGTRATELDQEYCATHPDAIPGRYVELTISDTGTGMTPEVAARIFEPFYTTKPIGRGAGLGLSTVYSIVTRAGGALSVQSEPGAGTAFRVFFPAAEAPARDEAQRPGSGQRILVVDDEPAVLAVASRILRKNGYAVLEAGDGEEAMSVAFSHDFDFDLLLTDSVLPRMSGQGLAERFAARKPGLRVLRMSGYSSEQPDPALLEKPFTAQTLLQRVRDVLSAPPGG